MNKSFLILFLVCGASSAWGAATPWQTNPQGRVRLISASNTAGGADPLWLGLQFQPAPGWYLYWKQPGEAGIPPKITWKSKGGFTNPEILWPSPTRLILPGNIIEFGYPGDVVYPIKARRTSGPVHFIAEVGYLTCNTGCVPYKYTFRLNLPTGDAVPDKASGRLIEEALQRVPPASETDEQIKSKAPIARLNPGGTEEAPSELGLFGMLFFAFVGGLILNVMPCVLPVLSIKLLGLVKQSGHAHSLIARNSLLSAAGIISSFLGLAFIASLAKSGGKAVGWGIQFQSPVFVAALGLIVFLFALNLWGVFEIGMPRLFGHFAVTYGQRETPAAHFMSGLFATLLATPCSAPFLGTAMGFALTQSSPIIFGAFASAGAGMASPYFLLAAFPRSLGWLPKPGPWMIRLKAFFGLLLAGTSLWLFWVLFRQVHPLPQEPFDESRIERLVSAGTPVLVDVTADWCVTCKYNEQFVLHSPEIKQALAKRGVLVMRADWTNRNETIRQYLARFGKSGIPFYALYAPGRDPVVLSEFLTKSKVLRQLSALDALQ